MDALRVKLHIPVAFAIGVQMEGGSARGQKVVPEDDKRRAFDNDEGMTEGLVLEKEGDVHRATGGEGLTIRSHERFYFGVGVSGNYGICRRGLEGFGGDNGEGGAGVGETFSGVGHGAGGGVVTPTALSRPSFAQEPEVLQVEGLRTDADSLRFAGEVAIGVARGGGGVIVGAG